MASSLSQCLGLSSAPALPSFGALMASPAARRLLPTTTAPTLACYVTMPPAEHVIPAVLRLGVGDSWYVDREIPRYLQTGLPVVTAFLLEQRLKHRASGNGDLAALLDLAEQDHPGSFLSFQVGEWENWMTAATDPRTPFSKDNTVFGATPAELDGLSRQQLFQQAAEAFRGWSRDVRGRIHSVNGYSLWTHIGAEIGEDLVGIETGEDVPSVQVARAFARGAARQFGLPYYEQISQWYRGTVPSGTPVALTDASPGGVHSTMIGAHTGHSLSLLSRLWHTAWFSGAASVCIEAATGYLFTAPYNAALFPSDAGLSPHGQEARKLLALMKRIDLVPYAPFGLLVRKDHGYMTYGGKPFGHAVATSADERTYRFFDRLFSGLSQGPGDEQRYLCPSPFGDSFDVLVVDADRSAWGSYPVILAIGEIAWASPDIVALTDYVRAGGLLGLQASSIHGWDRLQLGLHPEGFKPANGGVAAAFAVDGFPLVIRRQEGRGSFFVSADEQACYPVSFLEALADAYLPFAVEGEVETLIARTPRGWALLLVNNDGLTKQPTEEERIDPSRGRKVALTGRFPVAAIRDGFTGSPLPLGGSDGSRLEVTIGAAEMRLLLFDERDR